MPEMSLDEFSAYSEGAQQPPSGAAPARQIPPSVQAARDTESLDTLHAEKTKFTDPEDQASLDRQIHNRRQTSSQKEMSLGDFNKKAGVAEEKAPAAPPPQLPAPKTASDRLKSFAVGALKEVATLGDMAIGVPGGVASSIGELAMQADMAAHGISRDAGEAAAREFGQFIAEKSQPRILSHMVAHLAGEAGEEPTPGLIDRAMGKLNEWIDKGAEFVDTKSGHRWTKAEFQSEANLLMNLTGARALGKLGPEIGKKAEAKPVETIDPKDGNPTPEGFEALATKLKRVNKPRMMSPKDLARTQKAWTTYAAGKTTVEAGRVAKTEAAKDQTGSADPKLLAIVGGGVGAYLLGQAYPEHQDEGLATVLGLGMLGPRTVEGFGKGDLPLGSLVGRGTSTLNVLENLNQNHTSFPIKRLEEELRRPEIPKAEKDLFEHALRGMDPKGSISATDLVGKLRAASGQFELTGQHTDDYADYGLSAIDRGGMDPYEEHPQEQIDRANQVLQDNTYRERAEMAQPPGHQYEDYPHTRTQAQTTIDLARQELEQGTRALEKMNKSKNIAPQTTIWKSPVKTDLASFLPSDKIHFDDPNYFAHSRAFHEDGVKHVVEMQSDLVQKTMRPDAAEAAAAEYLKKADEAKQLHAELNDLYHGGISTRDPRFMDLSTRLGEAQRARSRAWEASHEGLTIGHLKELSPMWKDWHKRIVREELADSARRGQVVTRFATADTVAKVEGWPERVNHTEVANDLRTAKMQLEDALKDLESSTTDGEKKMYAQDVEYLQTEIARKEVELMANRFSKLHQGIYDRYKKETEPFLRKLGGKEHTDQFGHTWIEVPTGVTRGKAKMFGGATGDMMKTIAGATLGLAIANQLMPDDPFTAGVVGALAGIGAAHVGTRGVEAAFKSVTTRDTRIRINKLTEAQQLHIDRMNREVAKTSMHIVTLLPKKADREAVYKAIDSGNMKGLTPEQLKAASTAKRFFSTIANAAKRAGVYDSAIATYSTRLWEDTAAAKGLLERKQAAAGPKVRVHLTTQDGLAAGLKPKTSDIAEIMAIYGGSMGRSISTARLITDLSNAVTPAGVSLIQRTGKAPKEYVQVDSPALRPYRVHPDIAPSLRFALDTESSSGLFSGLAAINTALKRTQVSFSLFHAKSLLEAAIVAGHPLIAAKVFGQSFAPKLFGENKMLEQVRNGGVGDTVDQALKDGLVFSFERGEPADLDVGGGFYSGMRHVQNVMDKVLPYGIGKNTAKGYIKLNHIVDNFMWGRLHTALKLEVYAAKKEGLLEANAKAGRKLTPAEAGRQAARYTNDVFGGLNWQRLAEAATTKTGRDLALQLNSRTGRQIQGFVEFAPDWTTSTLRAFYKALPGFNKGNGLRGILKPLNETDLYRQQLVRFGMYYFTALNGINMAMSGHPIWENKDQTRIDLGDGRTMQAAKHSFEAFHLIQDPAKFVLNKLGTVPKEAADQALGVEYLNPKHMPPMKNRLEHLAKTVAPISVGAFKDGVGPGIANTLGVSIYGKTKKQKQDAAKERREAKHKKMLEAYKKANGVQQ